MTDSQGNRPRKRQKIRVEMKKNRARVARDKRSWTRGVRQESVEIEDTASSESVRAKGALSRKRTIVISDEETPEEGTLLRSGVVVSVRGLMVDVDAEGGHWSCTVRRMLRTRLQQERVPITVGDRIRFRPVAERRAGSASPDEGVIEQVEPRRTVLTRRYAERIQVIAANVDQAIIVTSVDDPPLRPHLIDRFLVAAHQGGLKPVLCLNKVDLEIDEWIADVVERYRNIGYTVLETSVPRAQGMDEFREVMRNQTSVIVGVSGVGKSSLLNAIEPGLQLRVGDLTPATRRGRHTTTTAELIPFSFGGYVVDTPGIRQFDLAEVLSEELEAYFIEFVERVPLCRFPDCAHLHEQDCAILAAVEAGEIHPDRYESYVRMMNERLEIEKQRYA
jgi:ribosome biogenesis GTPase